MTELFTIVLVFYMLFLYVFELTCSCKSLQNGPKFAGEDPSETTLHIINPQQLTAQWPGPSILIIMKSAIFFFSIGVTTKVFGCKMCLLVTHLANRQLGNTSHWSRSFRPLNKWPGTLILIIIKPGMVYLEIWMCTWLFGRGQSRPNCISPLALLLKPNVSVI